MKLGKIIKHIIGDMLEFYWNLLRIFLIEIFQKLEIGRKGLEGFAQYFEHDHVLKLIYMEYICPLSFPKLSQIFLKQ